MSIMRCSLPASILWALHVTLGLTSPTQNK